MSTTTSTEYFQSWGGFGSGASWSNLSNLATASGEASVTFGTFTRTSDTAKGWNTTEISAIPAGSQFVSADISYQFKKQSGSGSVFARAKLTGGTTFTTSSFADTSWHTINLSGDQTYWGLTGSAASVMSDIIDGTIRFEVTLTGNGNFESRLEDVTISLTYKEFNPRLGGAILCQ